MHDIPESYERTGLDYRNAPTHSKRDTLFVWFVISSVF